MKTFKERIKEVKTSRIIRFSIVSIIFLLWTIWLGNYWVLLVYPLLFDIYITQYIPYTWWKKIKNPMLRTIMSWIDAILYALILVYFIFAFLFQNFQIPTSSLEKSYLVGDYLLVSKLEYGPRVPNTPLHIPIVQHTIPILNIKSYFDNPQLDYHRLKGFGNVKRGDIVVFNFPAGDTVTVKVSNPDYYTLLHENGKDIIYARKDIFGDVIYRPVDRRENYVKRAIGLPGETLVIKDDATIIDGKVFAFPKEAQHTYYILTDGSHISDAIFDQLGISKDDQVIVEDIGLLNYLGMFANEGMSINQSQGIPVVYQLPLTTEMYNAIKGYSMVKKIVKEPAEFGGEVFPIVQVAKERMASVNPQSPLLKWTRGNFGPIYIPRAGSSIKLTEDNLLIYERIIRNYEGNSLNVKADGIYINGKKTDSYTFKMNYYWMMGDNRDKSADSRYWGFVPEDHIVGTPLFVLISFDKDKSIFNGGIRWNRILKSASSN